MPSSCVVESDTSVPAEADMAAMYAPVADELEQVRRAFDDALSSRFAFVSELCSHVGRYRGKMLRPLLVLLAGKACGGLRPEHVTLGAVVEMVHVATLVHDDVLDEADTRRRYPSVNARWGNEASVLLGDYLISHAFHLCSSLDSQEASRLIGSATNTVCEGELLEIAHRGDFALDEPTYFEIIRRKTAALTGVCCALGARAAGADEETAAAMEQYGLSVGIAFQIEDDLLDIVGRQSRCGKSLGRDLDKGTATLPLIRFLATAADDDRRRMLHLLGNGHADRRRLTGRMLSESGCIRYAQGVADRHVASALERLEVLPPSPSRAALEAIARFTTRRQH